MAERRVEDHDDSEEFRALKKAIGKLLRELRIERRLSGRKVAELAQISTGTYGVIECGRANVTLMSLHRIARALAVPLVSLLEDTPAQTTTGVKGVLAAVRDLGQAHRQLDLCQEELVRVSSRLQGFGDASQDALKQVANAEKAARRTDNE
jgi:transcriptional regulator with XRE-family HTH domain